MKDGGPAFPRAAFGPQENDIADAPGMSLRDWFAGQVLAGYKFGVDCSERDVGHAAVLSYWVADEMLKVRTEFAVET